MDLEQFNTMTADEAEAALRPCVDIDSWVDTLVAGRPYDDVASLLTEATRQSAQWTGDEVTAALKDHPRIGERHTGAGTSAEMSKQEQSGVDPTDADLQHRLADGNRRYEATFDRIYLVRAAGRSAEEMLALLEERLNHDPETELKVTTGHLGEIAALRLRGLFG